MKTHYFQRYHSKENVATANTMLLLSRLYSYSSDKFYRFLKSEFFSDGVEPEIVFTLQEKNKESVPDATITQEGFKLVVETKMSDWFYPDQLKKHLKAFRDEKNKVLITVAPQLMAEDKKANFDKDLQEYNKDQKHPVFHINTTFELLAEAIQNVIDEQRDYEMQEVLDDYLNYCFNDKLIVISESWKWMRVQLVRTTIKFNMKSNLYYDDIHRGFRAHDYLGLYDKKSVRAIGAVSDIIIAEKNEDGTYDYTVEKGELNDNKIEAIKAAIDNGKNYGYELEHNRYFFVDKFYETDFKKVTPYAPMGSRVFDLTQILGTNELPKTEEIAELLKDKTWT